MGIGRMSSATGPSPGKTRSAPKRAPATAGTLRVPCVPSGPPSGLTSAEGHRIVQRRVLSFTICSHRAFIWRYAPTPPAPYELRRRKRGTLAATAPFTSRSVDATSLDSYVSPAENRFFMVPTNESTAPQPAIASAVAFASARSKTRARGSFASGDLSADCGRT
jgi:hypothetical protein